MVSLRPEHPLWTKDYIILTLGSVISYMGNATMNFSLGLYILELKNSVLLYSIYLFLYHATKLIVPIIAGPYFDRFSRRKAIFILDYCSAFLYFLYWIMIRSGHFSYTFVFVGVVIAGAIDSSYRVAFNSLYPMMVHKDNLSRAFSISNIFETLSCIMIPIATALKQLVGIELVFIIGAVLFATAATVELFIRVDESSYQNNAEPVSLKSYTRDLKEGFSFVGRHKALLYVVLVYLFVYTIEGVQNTVFLPYYGQVSEKYGYYIYMAVTGAYMGGTTVASFILYFIRIPKKKRFMIVTLLMIVSTLFQTSTLYLPFIAAIIIQYIAGIFDITAFNMKSVVTLTYLDSDKMGRFNGIFAMACNAGMLVGEIVSGVLSEAVPLPHIYGGCGIMAFAAVVVLYVIIGRKPLSKLYSEEYTKETVE